MGRIKISIIIKISSKKYIKECLKNIEKQSLKDLELIFIETTNEDNNELLEIIKNTKLTSIILNNNNINKSLNNALTKAQGDYILFMNDKDSLLDDKALEKMYEKGNSDNINIVGGLCDCIDGHNSLISLELHRVLLVGFDNGRLFKYENTMYDKYFNSYIFKKDLIVKSRALFDENLRISDDSFFIKVFNYSNDFFVIPIEMYRYNFIRENLSVIDYYQILLHLYNVIIYSKNNKLDILHYITIQRINNDYGDIFEKYIRNGYFEFLRLVLDIQDNIDESLLKDVIINKPLDDIYESMNVNDKEIKQIEVQDNAKYILNILFNLTQNEAIEKVRTTNSYYQQLDDIINSKAYKIGKFIVWLPKKILQLFRLR